MKIYLSTVCVALACMLVGCGAPDTPKEPDLPKEFDTALRSLRAVITIGGTQEEFRTSLQALAASSDGSKRCEDLVGIYSDSLKLWQLAPGSMDVGFTGQSLPWTDEQGVRHEPEITYCIPLKNGAIDFSMTPNHVDWCTTMFELSQKHPEITNQSEQNPVARANSLYLKKDGLVQIIWEKASKM